MVTRVAPAGNLQCNIWGVKNSRTLLIAALVAVAGASAAAGDGTRGPQTSQTDPVKIEKDLVKIIPKEKWILFSHQIIHHGRALCTARSPKCSECALYDLCYAPDKTS